MKNDRRPSKGFRPAGVLVLWTLAASVCLLESGCINTLVMVSKVLAGDPLQKSAFELATGISLQEEEKRVLLHCGSATFLTGDYDTLSVDLQEELSRRMKRHDLQMVDDDQSVKVFERLAGTFDPQALAREIDDMNYIMHVQVDRFSYMENASPNLYRGNASGRIIGYEVRGEGEARHAVEVFDQNFQVTYPTTFPVSVDRTPKTVFIRRFIDHMADSLGASFYDVRRSTLFAD